MSTNPLIGAAWGGQPQTPPNVLSGTNPISLPGAPGPGSGASPIGNNPIQWGNPGGLNSPQGANQINRNMGLLNIETGQEKLALAPQYANMFGQEVGGAQKFFQQLMNLGSPYYQQKQTEGFNQGVQQNQNAAAGAQQKLAAQGYGNTPSGANAAMIGGMEQQGSQNLAEQYLQNLFQNENMQLQGAQGMSNLASQTNPTQLLGGTSTGADVRPSPSFFDNFLKMMQGLSGAGGQTSSGAGIQL